MTITRKVCLSIIGTVCGWMAGALWFSGYALLFWGNLQDVDVIVAWTTPFVFAGWILFFLPIVFIIDERHRLFRFPEFACVGTAVGIAAFMLLIGWWAPLWRESYVYLVYPGVSGAVAGTVYSLLLERQQRRANP